MKTSVKAVFLEQHFWPEPKGIVTLRLSDGKVKKLDLLKLHSNKKLFYRLPKKQIDQLSSEATVVVAEAIRKQQISEQIKKAKQNQDSES